MKKTNSHTPIMMSKLRSFTGAYLYFGLLFFLSFTAQLLLAQPKVEDVIALEQSGEFLKADLHGALGYPFSFPALPESPEDGDEDDRDDRVEDELSALSNDGLLSLEGPSKTACSIAQFQRKVENKSLTSLYILYHSWKSFLA